jgi:hypothetical protein
VDGQSVARLQTGKNLVTEYMQGKNKRIAVSMQRPVNNLQLCELQQQESKMKNVFYVVPVKLL